MVAVLLHEPAVLTEGRGGQHAGKHRQLGGTLGQQMPCDITGQHTLGDAVTTDPDPAHDVEQQVVEVVAAGVDDAQHAVVLPMQVDEVQAAAGCIDATGAGSATGGQPAAVAVDELIKGRSASER